MSNRAGLIVDWVLESGCPTELRHAIDGTDDRWVGVALVDAEEAGSKFWGEWSTSSVDSAERLDLRVDFRREMERGKQWWRSVDLRDAVFCDFRRKVDQVEALDEVACRARAKSVDKHFRRGEGVEDWRAEKSDDWVWLGGIVVLHSEGLQNMSLVGACGHLW